MAAREKWALITGVSEGGLGGALASEWMSRQIRVIATGPELKQLECLKPNGSTKLEKIELDVTSSSSITAAVHQVEKITNGQLDVLINNAGYGYMMPLLDADIDKVKSNFDVNIFGLLAVTQAFFPVLRASKGIVVNQASIAGLPNISQPFIGIYSASKAAVIDLSNTMRVELAPFGIRVITLVTGAVQTPFWDNVEGAHVGIPDSSPYKPIKAKVEEMMRGETNPPNQPSPDKWAKAVVDDLLRSDPPRHVRRGYLATYMMIVSWLVPVWVFDWLFTRVSDLGKLKAILPLQESRRNR